MVASVMRERLGELLRGLACLLSGASEARERMCCMVIRQCSSLTGSQRDA
jgi:hypothetical protein